VGATQQYSRLSGRYLLIQLLWVKPVMLNGYTAKLLGGLFCVFVYDCRAENGFCFWELGFHSYYLQLSKLAQN